MAVIELSLVGLFKQQFGIVPEQFQFPQLPVPEVAGSKGAPLYDTDANGRSYFMPVYVGFDRDSMIALPYPTISAEVAPRIIDTELTEQNGLVSELISIGAYRFMVRGLMIGTNGQWPEDQIAALNNLMVQMQQQQQPLIIECALTDIFLLGTSANASDRVTIRSLRFPNARGDIKVKPYEMELVSDAQFSLEQT
jgi:hypothetical protein